MNSLRKCDTTEQQIIALLDLSFYLIHRNYLDYDYTYYLLCTIFYVCGFKYLQPSQWLSGSAFALHVEVETGSDVSIAKCLATDVGFLVSSGINIIN